jgi:Amt family ammonium transporter
MHSTIVLLGAAVLLARVGQVLYATGLSRSKNSAAAAARGVADLCVAALAFWAVGAAVLLQTRNGVFAVEDGLVLGWSGAKASTFFYAAVMLVATGAVTGTIGERSRFLPACAAAALVAGLIVPVAGHWVWFGWLRRLGFNDEAGASAVHLAAGVCAAVGAATVGPRGGKYNRDRSANMIPGHNVPLAAAGALTMFVAWVPYVVGAATLRSDAALRSPGTAEAMNVLLAGAAGGAAAMAFSQLRYGKTDLLLALTGFLGGLVSITGVGGTTWTGGAVVIGVVAGVLVPLAAISLDLLGHLDDPTAGVAIHGVGGLWGTLAAGLFAGGSFLDRVKSFGVQLLGVVAIAALAAALSLALFGALKAAGRLRVKDADEYDGLDLAEHDIGAYPDFQQTMIKSYHLREA